MKSRNGCENYVSVFHDESYIVFDAGEKRIVDGGKCDLFRYSLAAEKSLVDFWQTILVIENISK